MSDDKKSQNGDWREPAPASQAEFGQLRNTSGIPSPPISGVDFGFRGAARQPEAGEPHRFRKKPVVITAIQYFDWMREKDCLPEGVFICWWPERNADMATIHTLEGDQIVSNGDWVITGVKGEKYPCKPDIFEATYEPAE